MISLQILCSGTPTPNETRWGSAYALKMDNEWIMFDCGPAATYKLVKSGISPLEISHLFFTHHHSDHDADYACFLLTRFDMSIGNEANLKVYGPPPTKTLTQKLIGENEGAYWHDFVARTNHPLSLWAYQNRGGTLPRKMPKVHANDIATGEIINGSNWTIECSRVEHVQPYLDSLAYRVNTDKGSIVFSGDTRPCQSLIELAKGSDVLVMECIRLEKEMIGNATSLSESSALAAGEIAQEAEVKMLILTHQAHYLDDSKEEVIQEVQKNYKGRIEWANETTRISY